MRGLNRCAELLVQKLSWGQESLRIEPDCWEGYDFKKREMDKEDRETQAQL